MYLKMNGLIVKKLLKVLLKVKLELLKAEFMEEKQTSKKFMIIN